MSAFLERAKQVFIQHVLSLARVASVLFFFVALFSPLLVMAVALMWTDEKYNIAIIDPVPRAWTLIAPYFLLCGAAWFMMRRIWKRPVESDFLGGVLVLSMPSILFLCSDTFFATLTPVVKQSSKTYMVKVVSANRLTKTPLPKPYYQRWLDVTHPTKNNATLSFPVHSFATYDTSGLFKIELPASLRSPGAIVCTDVHTGFAGIRWASRPTQCKMP